MRRLTRTAALILLIALSIAPACKRRPKAKQTAAAETSAAGEASTVNMADPRYASQLLKGFHNIEFNSWRWTQKDFAVSLSPPANAAQNGAILLLQGTIPDVVLKTLQSLTLSATLDGLALNPEHYTTAGAFSYRREIPADHLRAPKVTVEFSLDKALEPGADSRQLGLIVSQVGLEVK